MLMLIFGAADNDPTFYWMQVILEFVVYPFLIILAREATKALRIYIARQEGKQIKLIEQIVREVLQSGEDILRNKQSQQKIHDCLDMLEKQLAAQGIHVQLNPVVELVKEMVEAAEEEFERGNKT